MSIRVRVPAPIVLVLVVSSAPIHLPPPAFERGTVRDGSTAGPLARVWATTTWQLQLSTVEPTWQAGAGSNVSAKPASDLQWSASADGIFSSLSPQPVTIAAGGPGAATPVPIYLRVLADLARDAPGEYSITLCYTLVPP